MCKASRGWEVKLSAYRASSSERSRDEMRLTSCCNINSFLSLSSNGCSCFRRSATLHKYTLGNSLLCTSFTFTFTLALTNLPTSTKAKMVTLQKVLHVKDLWWLMKYGYLQGRCNSCDSSNDAQATTANNIDIISIFEAGLTQTLHAFIFGEKKWILGSERLKQIANSMAIKHSKIHNKP